MHNKTLQISMYIMKESCLIDAWPNSKIIAIFKDNNCYFFCLEKWPYFSTKSKSTHFLSSCNTCKLQFFLVMLKQYSYLINWYLCEIFKYQALQYWMECFSNKFPEKEHIKYTQRDWSLNDTHNAYWNPRHFLWQIQKTF